MRTHVVLAVVIAGVAFLGPAPRAGEQERITLTTPVFVDAGTREFRVWSLFLQRGPLTEQAPGPGQLLALITATFLQVDAQGLFVTNGRQLVCSYSGDEAETLLRALNTANLSTNSLERRVTTRCQTDGKLGPGTISGTPQE